MKRAIGILAILVLASPLLADAQGRRVPVCDRDRSARTTADEQGRVLFGAAGQPQAQLPGRGIAVGESFSVFGATAAGDGCPCGAQLVGGARSVWHWLERVPPADGEVSRHACLESPPGGERIVDGSVLRLGDCVTCQWSKPR